VLAGLHHLGALLGEALQKQLLHGGEAWVQAGMIAEDRGLAKAGRGAWAPGTAACRPPARAAARCTAASGSCPPWLSRSRAPPRRRA
jgi:hypothetical protein